MNISQWPSHERPREKLLIRGAESLSDAELLAIFLRTGVKGKTAVDLARHLLVQFGGLRRILTASEQEFCQPLGLGKAKYCQLQATVEMTRRHLLEPLQRGERITHVRQTENFLIAKLRDQAREIFACLFLDNQHQIIRYEEIFHGTIDCATVYPREIIVRALKYHAAAVILAHNHPSGNPQPSQADQNITNHLCQALDLIDIRVLDHLIIGDGQAISLAEKGLMPAKA